jgi:hypothetical protein
MKDILSPAERALIEETRENAAVTGEQDDRNKSDLRRGQRRLLAIIDKLLSLINGGAR